MDGITFDQTAKLQVKVTQHECGFSTRIRIVTPEGKLYGKHAVTALLRHARHLCRCRWMLDLALEYKDLWHIMDVPDGEDPDVHDAALIDRIEQFGRDAQERIAAHQGD